MTNRNSVAATHHAAMLWAVHRYPTPGRTCSTCLLPSRQTFLNPTAIFEVLSPTTEAYDRVEKFDAYVAFDTLQEYVLIHQDRPEVLSYFREPGGIWNFQVFQGTAGLLALRSVGVDLSLAEIYDRMTFALPADDAV